MRRLLLAIVISVAGCGHAELDFTLPDAGRDDRPETVGQTESDGHGPEQVRAEAAGDLTGSANAGANASANAGTEGGAPAGAASAAASAGAGAAANPQRFQDDPNGYPGGPEQQAMWCDQGQSFEEVCGNDVDEDCDGTVDEFAGIGRPCRSACGEGIYICDVATNSLVCAACSIDVPAPCGDGFVGAGEQCDPSAPGEQLGVTCTATCERPAFVRCVDNAGAHPEFCEDELEACNDRIGACLPVIGPRQRRCPEIPVEGGDTGEVYPMLEVQNEEDGPWECWVTCTESAQCPTTLSECYMGFCAVPL